MGRLAGAGEVLVDTHHPGGPLDHAQMQPQDTQQQQQRTLSLLTPEMFDLLQGFGGDPLLLI